MTIKLLRSLALCACSLLIINCAGSDRDKPVSAPEEIATAMDDKAAIDQLIASFQRSYNAHRPSMVADLYSDDARWMAAAGPILQGRQAITVALEQFMTAVPPVLTLTERDKVVVGDRAVSRGTYALTDELGGQARSIGGSYLNALRKDGEGRGYLSEMRTLEASATEIVERITTILLLGPALDANYAATS